MTEPREVDRAQAHRLNRGIAIMLIVGALAMVISAELTSGGPIATTLLVLASAAALWVAASPLRRR